MMIRLSKHIEILLLSNDCVIVPGFGGFMAHHVEARKDKSDGSFLPPMRSIGFNPKLTINDSLLAQSYVEAYDISYPDATMRIEDEVRELHQRIEAEGSYEFQGIGVISLNEEGNYEFAPCEAGILSPKLYGLDSFQMKTVGELRAYAESMLSKIEEKDNEKEEVTEIPVDNVPTEKKDDHNHTAKIIAIWRNVAVACIAVILFLLLPSPLVNNSQMAGTSVDTSLLDKVMPKDITTGQEKVSDAIKNTPKEMVAEAKAADNVKAKADDSAIKQSSETEQAMKEGFSIVVASHVTVKNAEAYVKDLHSRGYSDAFVYRNGHVKVLLGHYNSQAQAYKALNKLNDNAEFSGAWVKEVKY